MFRKLKYLKSIALAALLIILLSSCSDGRIAKQSAGNWKYGYTTTYDDGSKTKTDVYLCLSKDSGLCGGQFVESTVSTTKYYDEEGAAFHVPYCAIILGEWEIVAGNLFQEYDISSLRVGAYQDSIKVATYEDAIAIAYMSQLFESADAGFNYYRAKVAEEFNREMYTQLFYEYSLDNEMDKPYLDVEVKGTRLFFESSDLGTVACDSYYGTVLPGIELYVND